jgi:hypothetical protein
MDDLAPAPTQRTFDDVGRTPEGNFMARKKAMKKVQSAPAKKQDPDPEPAPEAEPEPELDHQLDLLA